MSKYSGVKQVTPKRYKICFAIPCTGTIRIETMLSIVGIMGNTPHDFYFAYRTGCYIEENRTNMIKTAIEQKCDKLFFLDSDIIVEHDVVNKLLAHNKPFIGADYHQRKFPLYSNIKIAGEDGKLKAVPAEEMPTTVSKVFGVPTGCMLIDIPTVQKIPLPWFDLTYFEDGSLEFGEDIFFCKKINEAGMEVWVDPTIQTGHIGTHVY